MMELFKKAGFAVELVKCDKWPSVPIARSKLNEEFSTFPDDDLLVKGFDVILRPQNTGNA